MITSDISKLNQAISLIKDVIGGDESGGFDSPVGTKEERRGKKVWPGAWLDASPFGRLYFVGTPSEAYHTGADLNLPADADAHTPVYSAADGVVTFADRLNVWGNVIIVRHNTNLYSRYAHVENMVVVTGDRVARGQQIANVSNAFGQWAYHLHFDISLTDILENRPGHWPGRFLSSLQLHYVDPREYIQQHRPEQKLLFPHN